MPGLSYLKKREEKGITLQCNTKASMGNKFCLLGRADGGLVANIMKRSIVGVVALGDPLPPRILLHCAQGQDTFRRELMDNGLVAFPAAGEA